MHETISMLENVASHGNEYINKKRLTSEELLALGEMNKVFAHTTAGSKHIVVSLRKNALNHEGHHIEPLNEFKNRFLHEQPIAGLNKGEAWIRWSGKRYFEDGLAFYPNHNDCPVSQYNMFTGFAIEPQSGDVMPFINHVKDVICAGEGEISDYVLDYLAHMVQKPDEKPSVAIVLKSVEGTGKGSFVKPIQQILGEHCAQTNGPYLVAGRFNSALANKLFVFVDEADLTDKRVSDKLKALISEDTLYLERKGIDPVPLPNYTRFIFATNQDKVLRAGTRERRYLVLQPSDDVAQDKYYFDNYYAWLNNGGANALFHFLQNRDITSFDPRRAPMTAALKEEVLANMNFADEYIYSELLNERPFGGGRASPNEIHSRFENFLEGKGVPLSKPQVRSIIGKQLKALSIEKHGRPGATLVYEFPDVTKLRNSFAKRYQMTEADIF